MNNDHNSKRFIQNEGLIHIYKNKLFGSKWKEIYAILYSDSTFTWFSKKDDNDPKGSLLLKDLLPYICIGHQIDKLPTKHPKMPEKWTNSLMAIATDQEACKIYWFSFETITNLKNWLKEIISTLPKLNPPAYEEKDNSDEKFDELVEPPPYENENVKHKNAPKKEEKKQNKKTNERTLDGTLYDYGFGRSFCPLAYFGLDDIPSSHRHDKNDNTTEHIHHFHHHSGNDKPHHHHHHHHNGGPSHKHHHNGNNPEHHINPKLQTSNTGPSSNITHHKHHTSASNGTALGLTHHKHHISTGVIGAIHHNHHHGIGSGIVNNHQHMAHHVTHHHTSHHSHFGGHHGHF